jgi:nitric oxide reductase subunit C
MGFYLKGFLAILLFSLTTFTWLIYYSATGDKVQPIPAEAEKGKMVFQKKACVECHTIFGNGGYAGGDLTKIYEKVEGAALKGYLTHPPVISGTEQKRHDKLTEEEADSVVAYLGFLNSINTTNWPPRPMYDDRK